MKNQELYAFWRHDIPPYLLGGKVEEIREDGSVRVEGFSGYFRSVKIVPLYEGIKLHKKLKKAEAKYRKTVEQANIELKDTVKEIIK